MVISPDFPIEPTAESSKFSPFLKMFLVLNLFSNEIPISSIFDCFISKPNPIACFFFEFNIILDSTDEI